jgi:hypothetical protein
LEELLESRREILSEVIKEIKAAPIGLQRA